MNLNIKKQPISIKDKRKLKLLHIEHLSKRLRKKIIIPVGFDWSLTAESKEENEEKLKNFHLFCISIVTDLARNNFKTNEHGNKTYLEGIDKNLVKKLNKLFSIVEKK